MLDWMSPVSFLQTIIKIILVWASFYGAGYLVEKFTRIRKLFPLLPREISGIMLLILLEIPLSVFGIMNRTVIPVLLLIFAVPGLLLLLRTLLNAYNLFHKVPSIQIIYIICLLFVAIINLTYASIPNTTFDDPLITYAVQPDRWLNSGKIFWLEETTFSGFPLTYEMIAVWPASLSSDRMDQLSVLQVFQVTLLFAALFRGMQIIKIRRKFRLPLSIIVLLCTMLYYWSSIAKTDTAAILFSTLALASAVRERLDKRTSSYSSWLFMGLALATKQTALLILIPFGLYKTRQFLTSSMKTRVISLFCIASIPMVFAVRTLLHTGSPFYPVHSVSSLVKDEWKLLPPPYEISLLNDRTSELHKETKFSTYKNIGIFVTSMEGVILLLLGGLGVAVAKKNSFGLFFLPLFAYFAVAIVVLWPPWWGAKYSILIYPFTALLGVKSMQNMKRFTFFFLPATALAAFVVPGFVIAPNIVYPSSYRYTVAEAVFTASWNESSGYHLMSSTPDGMTQMWLNSAIPKDSRILSIHEEKRYFYDGVVFVGWRHPATQTLYLNNTLEEECAILDRIGIDYVTFYRTNPGLLKMENRLAILDNIGNNDILEPVISVNGGIVVCRYNSPSF